METRMRRFCGIRVGHWAQAADDWIEAETCFRKGF